MAYIFCVLITSMIWISAIVTKRSADRSYFALNTAEHANRAKTAFLNNMSHDIRTPMNAIIGFTALAAAHVNQPDQVQEYLNKISTSGQHLLSLINDVLGMSRIESGRVKIEEKEVHLPDVMHDLRTIVNASIVSKNIVDMMGGTISVESEEGKGTEYTVSIPFQVLASSARYEIIPQLQGVRVLVADDDSNTAISVSHMVQEIGMVAEWTLSGKEAVLRTKVAVEQNREFGAYIIAKVLG